MEIKEFNRPQQCLCPDCQEAAKHMKEEKSLSIDIQCYKCNDVWETDGLHTDEFMEVNGWDYIWVNDPDIGRCRKPLCDECSVDWDDIGRMISDIKGAFLDGRLDDTVVTFQAIPCDDVEVQYTEGHCQGCEDKIDCILLYSLLKRKIRSQNGDPEGMYVLVEEVERAVKKEFEDNDIVGVWCAQCEN